MPVEMTPLADASARGNVAIVELLVESRAEVNATGLVRREGREGGRGREVGGREGGGKEEQRERGKEGSTGGRKRRREGGREDFLSSYIHVFVAGHKRSLTHHTQISRLGIQCHPGT